MSRAASSAESPPPVRAMLTRAFTILLLFQLLGGLLVAPLFSLFAVYIEERLGLPATTTSLLRVLFVALGGVVALAGGALVDRLGRKRALLLAMLGVVASGGLYLTDRLEVLIGLALVAGILFGFGAVANQAYLMDAVPRASLGLATACFFMTGTAGNAVGNAVAGRVVTSAEGYGILGWAMVVGQIGVLLLAAWLLPEISAGGEGGKRGGAQRGGLRELIREPGILPLIGLRFLPTVYWGAVTLLIPLLLFRLTGKRSAATDYTAASLVVASICQVVAGRLVDRIGPRGPVLTAIAIVAAAALGKAVLAQHVWGIVLFGLIGSGAAWALSVTMTTLIQELSTDETRARLLGVTHTVWSAGFVTGTMAAGILASVRGREAPTFFLGAACCGAGVFCALGVMRALEAREKGEGVPAGAV